MKTLKIALLLVVGVAILGGCNREPKREDPHATGKKYKKED